MNNNGVYYPKRLVLISCSATKKGSGTHPAWAMYTSPLFLRSVRWAERHGQRWAVISAKHGLILPAEEIEAYDMTMSDMTAEERLEWARRVCGRLDYYYGIFNQPFPRSESAPDSLAILAGEAYTKPLLKVLGETPRYAKIPVSCPLAGLGIGHRLAWLNNLDN